MAQIRVNLSHSISQSSEYLIGSLAPIIEGTRACQKTRVPSTMGVSVRLFCKPAACLAGLVFAHRQGSSATLVERNALKRRFRDDVAPALVAFAGPGVGPVGAQWQVHF